MEDRVRRWYRDFPTRVRQRANAAIRRSAGLTRDPPPRCDDPREAYADVEGVARLVHGELPSMLVGGLGSLFLQMLHPLAMAGVADHSRYQDDPLGRLLQTANFINATTYGTTSSARVAIERVLKVHEYVHGVTPEGVAYDANDPHLLLWVHCAEISMFLRGYRRFGARRLTDAEADHYVAEMVPLARDLGVLDPPTTVAQLDATLERFRPELRLSAEGVVARDFIAYGLMKSRLQRVIYRLFVLSAWALLPTGAAETLGVPTHVLGDRLFVRPATRVVCWGFRLAVPPVRQVARVSPPSTATT
jgi:uncharacterized protein (DUF2236 family)